MILDWNVKKILCFGDSNTWGQSDDKDHAARYDLYKRWPGRIQMLLGNEFEVYEEGLGGRNTTFDHYNSEKAFRNGIEYFKPYLQSHNQFDLIVIMLGTNDLKMQYNQSVEEIASSIEEYVEYIKNNFPTTNTLVVSPPLIDAKSPLFHDYYADMYDLMSAEKSQMLGAELKRSSHKLQVSYINAAQIAQPGRDGIHLTEQSHAELADALRKKIQEILK